MPDRLPSLLKLHDADPADAELPYMIALEHAKSDATTDALAWLDKAIATDPHFAYAFFQKAKLLSQQGQDDQALATLDQGLAAAQASNNAKALGELQELKASLM